MRASAGLPPFDGTLCREETDEPPGHRRPSSLRLRPQASASEASPSRVPPHGAQADVASFSFPVPSRPRPRAGVVGCLRRCRHPRLRPGPGHPLPAPARREPDPYRVRARQRPVACGPRRGRRHAAHQFRGRGDRSCVQRGRAVDRLFGTVRGEHRRLPDARYGRPAAATHLASGGRPGAGMDAGRRDPLPVGPGRGAHPAVEVLHGAAGRRSAGAARAAAGVPGRDVRGRGIPRLPGDRPMGPGVAQLPGRAGAADRHRLDRRLGAHHALLGRRAAHGPGVDGRRGLLHVGAGLGEQRVVVRPAHRGGAPDDAARRLRREIARGRGRRRGLRAGGVSARTGSRVRAHACA